MKSKNLGFWMNAINFFSNMTDSTRKRRIFFCNCIKFLRLKVWDSYVWVICKYAIKFLVIIMLTAPIFYMLTKDYMKPLNEIKRHKIKYITDSVESGNGKKRPVDLISPSDYASAYSAQIYFFGNLLIMISIGATLFTINQQINQRNEDKLQRKIEQNNAIFFGALNSLEATLSRFNVQGAEGDDAFIEWLKIFENYCNNMIVKRISASKLDVENFGSDSERVIFIIQANGINVNSKFSEANAIDNPIQQAKAYYDLLTYEEYVRCLEDYNTIRDAIIKIYWKGRNESEKNEIIIESAKNSYKEISYAFGPFFKKFNRILELSERDKDGLLPKLLKAQLTSHQMISIQANCVLGLCNEFHLNLIRKHEMTNDSQFISTIFTSQLDSIFNATNM